MRNIKIIRYIVFSLVLLIAIISCKRETYCELKTESFDNVFFYLSEMKVINSHRDLHLIGVKKIKEKSGIFNYLFAYQIKDISDSLYLVQYCDVETKDISFYVELSNNLSKHMDSINAVNLEKKIFPLHKRWDWIIEQKISGVSNKWFLKNSKNR